MTLTISTFFAAGACEASPRRRIALNTPRIITHVKWFVVVAALLIPATLVGHEAERTRVTLTLSADGSFVLDVANDPMWLLLRLETFAGGNARALLLMR